MPAACSMLAPYWSIVSRKGQKPQRSFAAVKGPVCHVHTDRVLVFLSMQEGPLPFGNDHVGELVSGELGFRGLIGTIRSTKATTFQTLLCLAPYIET